MKWRKDNWRFEHELMQKRPINEELKLSPVSMSLVHYPLTRIRVVIAGWQHTSYNTCPCHVISLYMSGLIQHTATFMHSLKTWSRSVCLSAEFKFGDGFRSQRRKWNSTQLGKKTIRLTCRQSVTMSLSWRNNSVCTFNISLSQYASDKIWTCTHLNLFHYRSN